MKKPFFSIIIPTRNRHETIKYTIKSILNQSFQNYEIIICDNNSTRKTREVVDSFHSSKIKYVRSNVDLDMTSNWELALSYAKGKYITIIADNDGFIAGALQFIYNILIINNKPNLLRFEKNTYNWPSLESVNKNIMYLKRNPHIYLRDSKQTIENVLKKKIGFQSLPMIYNSFVKNKLIKKIKQKQGKFFNAYAPDIYSGFMLAYLSKQYLTLGQPISIGANSAKSNGFNGKKASTKVNNEFNKLAHKSSITWSQEVPFIRSLSSAIFEPFLKVKKDFNIKDINYNKKEIFLDILNDLHLYDTHDIERTTKKIIDSCKDDKDTLNFINDHLKKHPLKINKFEEKAITTGLNINSINTHLTLNAKDFSLTNVYQVSKFMSGFYNFSLKEINIPVLSKNLQELQNGSNVIIWGNGKLSKDLIKTIQELKPNCKLISIVDSFQENKDLDIPVLLPENTSFKNIDYLIIASTFANEIIENFNTLNFKKSKILKFF